MVIIGGTSVEVEGVEMVELDNSGWADARQALHVGVDHRSIHSAHVVEHSLVFGHHLLRILEVEASSRQLTGFRTNVRTDTTFFWSSAVVAHGVHHRKVLAVVAS